MRPIKSFRSKNELVYASIRSAILQGELPPGQRLVIDEMASELGVSQIPVREALRQLEADGFVVIEPYIGATVTGIEIDLVYEIFGLLEAMEIISGRGACQHATPEDFASLERVLRGMDGLLDNPEAWSQENMRLHQLVCDYGRTPLVKTLMVKALNHWDRLHNMYLKDVFVHRIAGAHRQHWAMFEAISTRDCDRLEALVREHNRTALQAYTNVLEKQT